MTSRQLVAVLLFTSVLAGTFISAINLWNEFHPEPAV